MGIGFNFDLGGLFGGEPDVDYRPMKKRLQWLVADAKKAGIHPVAALGGAGGPGPVVSQRRAPVSANVSTSGLTKAETRAANARAMRDEALAAEVHSRIARMKQVPRNDYGFVGGVAPGGPKLMDPSGERGRKQPFLQGPTGHRIQLGPGDPQQLVEDELGGFIGELYGISRAVANVWRKARKKQYRHYRKDGGRTFIGHPTTPRPRKKGKRGQKKRKFRVTW